MTTKKPEVEQFIQAFNTSSIRTRTLLIGLLFASILAFIALLDSFVPFLSWYSSRIEIRQVALEWFIFPEENPDSEANCKVICMACDSNKLVAKPTTGIRNDNPKVPGVNSIQEFAKLLEASVKDSLSKWPPGEDSVVFKRYKQWDSSQIERIMRDAVNLPVYLNFLVKKDNKVELPYWIKIRPFESVKTRSIPDRKRRKALYKSLSRAALAFNGYSPHTRKEFEYALENLMEAQAENLTLVRMPILGISFDINFLGFISGGIFYALMALLYLSMVREDRNLKTLFQQGWQDEDTDDGRLYELLSMYQVLTVPQKLYRQDDQKDMMTRKFIVGVFWFPFIVLALIFSYDLYSFKIGLSLNPLMTVVTSFLTLISLLLIGVTSRKLTDRQTRINRLWDNQYFRLHLGNLIAPETNQRNASRFATLPQAKINWANAAYQSIQIKPLTEKMCVERFRMFLNLCYDKFEDKRISEITDAQEEAYWKKLEIWFEDQKHNSTRKIFRVELVKMMNSLTNLEPSTKSEN